MCTISLNKSSSSSVNVVEGRRIEHNNLSSDRSPQECYVVPAISDDRLMAVHCNRILSHRRRRMSNIVAKINSNNNIDNNKNEISIIDNSISKPDVSYNKTARSRTIVPFIIGRSLLQLLPSFPYILPTLCCCLLSVIVGQTSVSAADHSETHAMMYLSEYGYLSPTVKNPHSGHIMSEEVMSKAIADFQSFAGLNLTGYLDDDTLDMMSLPRCGVRDKIGFATDSRFKRYALQGSRWRVKDLTYKISKYPRAIGRAEVDDEVARAFSVWSDVTPLTFSHKPSGQVHIEIRFETYEHGDGDPFDGPGGTLAHAFFPVYGGDAHFDDSEKWSINSYRGTNLFQVAAHEFGHSLGLSHSDVRSSLMAPFYRGYNPSFSLDSDDIEGIQALYGKKSGGSFPDDEDDDDSTGSGSGKPTSTLKPPATPEGDPQLCRSNGSTSIIDTIFNSAEGVTYVFKGIHYWKLTDDGLAVGYPKLISRSWIGLPASGNIDAAFTYKNGKTYFFKGSKYWRYTGKKVDGEGQYPKTISEGFAGIPDNIQAAMVWTGNGKIYFFKGSKFWRFDPTQKPPVKSTYPKPISNWAGIPDDLDSALHYTNGYTYFFKGDQYYRFNDRTFSVDTADPPFPRNAGYWWFGCRNGSNKLLMEDKVSEKSAVNQNHEDNVRTAYLNDTYTIPKARLRV